MVEIEKKYRLTEERAKEVTDALQRGGGKFIREDLEENTIYGGEILAESGAVIRIRKTGTSAVWTYKRRLENRTEAKHHVEHETTISDPEAAARILWELGLRPRLVYEKRRKIWQFRDCEVVIDELPFGLFMEIEGSLTSIKAAEMLLDIEDLEIEQRTYPALTATAGTKVGDVVESRFN